MEDASQPVIGTRIQATTDAGHDGQAIVWDARAMLAARINNRGTQGDQSEKGAASWPKN